MQRSLSAGQISEYLEISIDTVSSRIRAGNFPLPDVIIGNHYQGWAPETIDEWHSCERGGGTLTRYATQWGAAIGMVCGFALNLWLWQ
jgi:predicted DNA-binding transcriptional regulator AlpA